MMAIQIKRNGGTLDTDLNKQAETVGESKITVITDLQDIQIYTIS